MHINGSWLYQKRNLNLVTDLTFKVAFSERGPTAKSYGQLQIVCCSISSGGALDGGGGGDGQAAC